jgi:hypothetical protein
MMDTISNIAMLVVVLMLGGTVFVGVMMYIVYIVGLLDD